MGKTLTELMSASLANSLAAQQSWSGLLILANNYGAKPGEDSTAAIQKAIDDAKSQGKHEVWFQPGDYFYTTLTNTDGIVFVGDGVTVTGSPTIPVVSIKNAAQVDAENTFTRDQTIGGKARPLIIFQTSNDANSTTNGVFFRNQAGENKWVAGYHPATGHYKIYDYVKASNRMEIVPNGPFLIDGGQVWTEGNMPYEHGTFTPEIFGAGTAGSNTYSSQEGRYVRIGNLVYASINVVLSAKDPTMAGGARIRGLPFAPTNAPSASVALGRTDFITFPANAKQIVPYFVGTAISMRYIIDGANGSEIQAANLANNSRIQVTAVYYIS